MCHRIKSIFKREFQEDNNFAKDIQKCRRNCENTDFYHKTYSLNWMILDTIGKFHHIYSTIKLEIQEDNNFAADIMKYR
jgi:hypothetical protein